MYKLRTGKEIRFRFGSSEDKAGKEAKRRPTVGSLSFADTASRSRSQPKMEDNLFTSPKEVGLSGEQICSCWYLAPPLEL